MSTQSLKRQKAKDSSIRKYKGRSTNILSNILNEIEEAKNRKIYGYRSKSKSKIINNNNNNKENINSIFKSKRNKIERILCTPSEKKPLKPKIKEIIKILYDMKKEKKTEKIKK